MIDVIAEATSHRFYGWTKHHTDQENQNPVVVYGAPPNLSLLVLDVIAIQLVEVAQVQFAASYYRMGPTGAHGAIEFLGPLGHIGDAFCEEASFDLETLGGEFAQEHFASFFAEDVEHPVGPADRTLGYILGVFVQIVGVPHGLAGLEIDAGETFLVVTVEIALMQYHSAVMAVGVFGLPGLPDEDLLTFALDLEADAAFTVPAGPEDISV